MKRKGNALPVEEEEDGPLPDLPLEIWCEVWSHLKYTELMRWCALVCKEWYDESFLCVRSLDPREMRDVDDTTLRKMKNLRELFLFQTTQHMKYQISNKGIETLCHLKKLMLGGLSPIDNEGVKKLAGHLTHFSFSEMTAITDEGIKGMTKLKHLGTSSMYNNKVTNEGLKGLTTLTSLNIINNDRITDECIAQLTRLRLLSLENNKCITGECLSALTKLEDLNLSANHTRFEGRFLLGGNLSNSLTSLNLSKQMEHQIEDDHLQNLTQLRKLVLDLNFHITDRGLSSLRSLSTLKLGRNLIITNTGVESLTNLRKLSLVACGNKGVRKLNPDTLSTEHGLVVKKKEIPAPLGMMRILVIARNQF